MKSRKNGSASIPTKEMRGQRHVTVLKGWKSGEVRGTRGKRMAKTREAAPRSVEVHRRRRKNGQSSEGRSEARKRKWRCDDAGRLVSPFFHSFFLRLLLFSHFSSCSRCQLHDRRLKSHRATPNVITLVLFHLRSICRFEQTHVNTFPRGQLVGQPVHQRCLSATVYLSKLRLRRRRLRGYLSRLVNRRGRDRVSHTRFSLRIP